MPKFIRFSAFVFVTCLFSHFVFSAIRFESPRVDPLIESPGKTIGSDFNGDGIHDLAVSAHLDDSKGNATGEAYILYGTQNLSRTYDLSSLGGPDVTIQGRASSYYFGYETSSAGDVNADGFDDLIIGAWAADAGGGGSGVTNIIYGSPNLSATFSSGDSDVTIVGRTNNIYLGFGTNVIGDFNGDGFDDVMTNAPFDRPVTTDLTQIGVTYVLFGSASLSATYNLAGTGVDVTLRGQARYDQFGREEGGAGDVNLDGFDDLIIGARLNNDGGTDDEGAAYILYGGSSISGTITAGNHDVTLLGQAANDYLGRDVSGMGDINGDGFDDIVAGADYNDSAVGAGGSAHILYGRSSLAGTFDTGSFQEDMSIIGVKGSGRLGRGISGLGDVNDDGFSDWIIGAIGANETYVFYGGVSLPSNIRTGNNDVTITGKGGDDQLGWASSGIGDINNDGFPDIATGAVVAEGLTASAGAAYVVFGGKSISSAIALNGTGADVTIAGKNNSDRLGLFIGGGHMNRGP